MTITVTRPEALVAAALARWGLYGDNGTGKSTFLSTVPPGLLTLVVSVDQENVKPYKGKPHIWVAKISEWDDVGEVYRMLAAPGTSTLFKQIIKASLADPEQAPLVKARMADAAVLSGQKPFWDVVGFDTWTRVQGLAANFKVGYKLIQPGKELEYLKRVPTTPKGWDEWGQIGALSNEWMGNFLRLPIHTIFLFQEMLKEPKEGSSGIAQVNMALTPSAVTRTKEVLEMVGRLYVALDGKEVDAADAVLGTLDEKQALRTVNAQAKERRMLLVGKHDLYFAKGDTRRLGYVVEEPTWDKLAVTLGGS